MVDVQSQLNALLSTMHIAGVPVSAQPGQQIFASLAPSPGELSITDVLGEPIGLDIISKDVVFSNQAVPDNPLDPMETWLDDVDVAKVLPLYNLAAVVPVLDSTGFPGLLARLKGLLPVALRVVPSITVKWSVTDEHGNDVGGYVAPAGLNAAALNLVFLPVFERLEVGAPAFVSRKITAQVTLAVAGRGEATLPIGPVTIQIPTIPIPQLIALAKDLDYKGPAIVVVPERSGLRSLAELRELLAPIRNLVSTLAHVAEFADMLTGLDTLTTILNEAEVHFYRRDRIDDLQDVTLHERTGPDVRADDELSSFVYISPPAPSDKNENRIELCNDKKLKRGEGRLVVGTGPACVALCRSLHSADPPVLPAGASIDRTNPSTQGDPPTFGNELNSLQFLYD